MNRTGGNGTFINAATGPAYDLQDKNAARNANRWRGNSYQTASPACTTQ